jgi:hypothetical protein
MTDFFPDKFNKLRDAPRTSVSRISRISRQKKKLNYFYKISLRIPTILVRDFSRIEVVINYDEVDVRFFFNFLKF